MGVVLALALALLGLAPASGWAAEYRVDTTADGLGDCGAAGQCTLRQALQSANGTPERDLVRVPAGTYELTGQDLIVTMNDQVDVVGDDPRTTVLREAGGGDGRVFLLEQNSALALANVTLTGATESAVLLFGGGIDFRAGNVTFAGNSAARGAAIDGTGGAVTLTNSTVAGNVAGDRGGGVYLGGAAATLSAVNSTIDGNQAPSGAGVYVGAGSATLTHATLADALHVDGGASASLRATIVGGCAGSAPASLGYNLSPGATCGLGAAGDRPGAEPLLGPLQDNGGLTATRLPAAGSPALDAAAGCPPPDTDQRGVARFQGSACDIGAVEAVAPPPPPPPPPLAPAVLELELVPRAFRAAERGPALTVPRRRGLVTAGRASPARPARRRAPVGATLRFRLDQAATVRLRVRRKLSGRRVGGRCVRVTRRNRRARRCTRLVVVRGAYLRARAAGSHALRFRGRWKGRRLRPGGYRLSAVARQGSRTGPVARVDFRIVR